MAYPEEYLYKTEKFTSFGMFNGFPFSLVPKPEYIMMETGIITGQNDLEVTVNHYWNLAALEVDFVVRTDTVPSPYISGIAYNPEATTIATGHVVTLDYEICNSYDTGAYIPEDRVFREVTGNAHEEQSVDENGLIVGSGNAFTSFYVTDSPDFYTPLVIQPQNTGAFMITLDSGVADWFKGKHGYANKVDKFEVNMLMDFGVSLVDEKTQEYNNIDYYNFEATGYLVPADGWEFSIEGSKVKGLYYTYSIDENDNPDSKGNIKFSPPKSAHGKFIKKGNKNTILGEPNHENRSKYIVNPGTHISTCNLGGAGGNRNSNTTQHYVTCGGRRKGSGKNFVTKVNRNWKRRIPGRNG